MKKIFILLITLTHSATVTVISRPNKPWSLVHTDSGEEDYAYSQYLTQQ